MDLNAVAQRARDAGLAVGHHNHDDEIRHDFDGMTGLEVFAEALDDDIVLEVDTFWPEVGGVSAYEPWYASDPEVPAAAGAEEYATIGSKVDPSVPLDESWDPTAATQ